ncbi:Methionine synthase [compost metagenome]
MATVKGDVHDIGKNIVSVVLACNNYEIIDLGIMVPAEKILETAIAENADVIGLSGLITPSLDEMVHVAAEMQHRGLNIPLLIGGATTSKVHTAVKIDAQYQNTVIHVNDASRAVNVVSSILSQDRKAEYGKEVKEENERIRHNYLNHNVQKDYLSLADARANKLQLTFDETTVATPHALGVKVSEELPLEELRAYIDWSPFFRSWDLHGKFPDILTDKVVGTQATALFKDAQEMLQDIIDRKLLTAKAVWGIFPANRIQDDDIEVLDPQTKAPLATFYTLRQQTKKAAGIPNIALSDFVAPKESGIQDYVGCFCVTAGFGTDVLSAQYEAQHDDYNSIMVKALADRLAEAYAEYLHTKVRKEDWGYAATESLTNEDLIKERYKGIRPAPGYPACPDHLEKETIWQLLQAEERIGVSLTESLAMWPAASVSGYYFAHEGSKYFGLGRIKEDQLADFAQRKNIELSKAKKWLSPNLAD